MDLRSAFHQLELTAVTTHNTFQSEDRIKRFSRLIFGEDLQHAIRTLLAGLEGAINIADYVVVFGDNTEAHDKAFKKVLQRLAEKCLTLNLEKCLFNKESLRSPQTAPTCWPTLPPNNMLVRFAVDALANIFEHAQKCWPTFYIISSKTNMLARFAVVTDMLSQHFTVSNVIRT